MAHAKDDHNKADAYHHMAGKQKKAHEGSQSFPPQKNDNNGQNVPDPTAGQENFDNSF